ncbi:uncharacterized protein si:ch211-102c2.4 [Alosa sapidissima]|uniref:uncharacterized protein si:ch211-102c2.4 n=1 Tax=Alosa sapidissima TaxID=34773 RepID=UPI001C0A51DC|nr:uncharacterized protein si:ch211-102c2.4 [Alosa sapidissima]
MCEMHSYNFVLIFVLILTESDICNSWEDQTLVCRYGEEYASLERVWCKKESEKCCTGLAFSKKIRFIDNGSVEITDDVATAFTVTVQKLSQGDGVYWCGLVFKNQTIIKLAEKYFPNDSSFYAWSFIRWILFPFLPLSILSICMLKRRTVKTEKVAEGTYSEIPLRARGADREADNTVIEE